MSEAFGTDISGLTSQDTTLTDLLNQLGFVGDFRGVDDAAEAILLKIGVPGNARSQTLGLVKDLLGSVQTGIGDVGGFGQGLLSDATAIRQTGGAAASERRGLGFEQTQQGLTAGQAGVTQRATAGGFAGSGAVGRARQQQSRAAGRQQGGFQTQFGSDIRGLNTQFGGAVSSAGRQVDQQFADLLASLGSGLSGIRSELLATGVELRPGFDFGAGTTTGGPSTVNPDGTVTTPTTLDPAESDDPFSGTGRQTAVDLISSFESGSTQGLTQEELDDLEEERTGRRQGLFQNVTFG